MRSLQVPEAEIKALLEDDEVLPKAIREHFKAEVSEGLVEFKRSWPPAGCAISTRSCSGIQNTRAENSPVTLRRWFLQLHHRVGRLR